MSSSLPLLSREELREKLSRPEGEVVLVGSVFKRLAPMLKMYGDYVNNYEEIMKKLDELRKKNTYPPLEKFIQKFCNDTLTPDISFFLILPIQRLPRYEMLIDAVRKWTPPAHPDYDLLNEAHEKVKITNNDINEKKRADENAKKISKIEFSIVPKNALREDFKDGLWSQDRLFLRKTSLSAVLKYKKRTDKKAFFYFVFNDLMLKTSTTLETDAKARALIAKKGRSFKYFSTIRFARAKLDKADAMHTFSDGLCTFQVLERVESDRKKKKAASKKKDKKNAKKTKSNYAVHLICCDSEEERDLWIKDLNAAIKAVRKKK